MSQRKPYKPWSPTQTFLLPPSPMEWLPKGHLAYFILDVVSELDLSELHRGFQEKDARGARSYSPEMMVALLLYGYSVGVFSSRKLAKAVHEDVAFRVLAAGHLPHFTTINSFRKAHLTQLSALFLQVLKICQASGLVKLGLLALDGTKVEANASKRKAMSYERMLKTELRLVEEIEALLARADQQDLEEDARFGEGQQEEDLPDELQRRESRLATIRKAKLRLEKESRQKRARILREQAARAKVRESTAENSKARKTAATVAKNKLKAAKQLDDDADDDDVAPPRSKAGLKLHEPQVTTDGKPKPKAQMSFTDPDSRVMKGAHHFVQGYNAQALVDSNSQIIVAQALTNTGADNAAFVPMAALGLGNIGSSGCPIVADAGYWHPDAPKDALALGFEALISTSQGVTGEDKATPPRVVEGVASAGVSVSDAVVVEDETPREAMRKSLEGERERELYAQRKAIVEPVFGQIKEARGFRRFLLRGLENVEAEWSLICTTHNLLKLWRHRDFQTA